MLSDTQALSAREWSCTHPATALELDTARGNVGAFQGLVRSPFTGRSHRNCAACAS